MVRVWVDDVEIPREAWAVTRPRPGRYVYIKTTPHGGGGGGGGGKNILASVLMLLVVVGAAFFAPIIAAGLGLTGTALTIGTALIGGALTMLGALAVNALIPPPSRDDGLVGQMALLSGVRNQMRPYAEIPRIFGRRRVYPLLAARPYTEAQGKDRYLRVLLCVGWGPLRITNIKVGNTPIGAFEAITHEVREGWTNEDFGAFPSGKGPDTDQTIFTKQVLEENFNIALQYNAWEVRRTEGGVSEISVDVAFPAGLVRYDDDGDRNTTTVEVLVQYRRVGLTSPSDWADAVWDGNDPDDGTQTNGRLICTDSSRTPVFRGGRFKVPYVEAVAYDVRLVRVTEERGSQYVDMAEWIVLRSIQPQNPVNLKGMALIALRMKATGQLNGLPDTINCVAESYLPTRNGSSWRYGISRNPAWAYADVMRRRGTERILPDARIDLGAIQRWAEECSNLAPNATEARWNVDAIFEGGSIMTALRQIGAHGRGAFAMRDGKYSVVLDTPQTVPVQIITPRNSWGYSGTKAFIDLPHALRVSYINAANGYQEDEIIVYADGYSKANAEIFERLDLPACTSATMAWREGRYHLAVGQLRPEEHTVNMDIEALRCNAGDLVHLAHDVLSIGYASGRITKRVVAQQIAVQTEDIVSNSWGKQNATAVLIGTVATPLGDVQHSRITAVAAGVYGFFQSPNTGQIASRTFSFSAVLWTDAGQPTTVFLQMWGLTGTEQLGALTVTLTSVPTLYRFTHSFTGAATNTTLRVRISGPSNTPAGAYFYAAAPQLVEGQPIDGYQANPTSSRIDGLVLGYELDETIQMDVGQSYVLRTRRSPGGIALEPLASVSQQILTNEVRLATLISQGDASDAGDLFVFGEAERETAPMLVRKIEPSGNLSAKLTLVDAQQGVHSADTGEIPAFESYASTQDPYDQQIPASPIMSLKSDESMVERMSDGTLRDRIGVIIAPMPSSNIEVSGVVVEFRETGGAAWISAATVDADTRVIYVDGVVQGRRYDVRAKNVTRTGHASAWTVALAHIVTGRTTPPANVTGFTAVGRVDGVQLQWNLNTEIDIAGYEIRRGDVWASAALVARRTSGPSLFVAVNVAQNQTFQIRAVDVLGLQSPAAATATAAVVPPGSVARFEAYPQGENIRFVWSQVEGPGVMHEIRCGDEWATAQRVARVAGTTTTLAWPVTAANVVRFWIKAVAQSGLYSPTARLVNVPRTRSQGRNVVLAEDFAEALWSDPENVITDMALVPIGPGETWLQTATDGSGLSRSRGELCRMAPLINIPSTRSWMDFAAAGSSASLAWQSAAFSWENSAGMTWLGGAVADDDVTITTYISLSGAAMPINLVEAWRFDASTTGANGTALVAAITAVYAPCRFSRGLNLSGFLHTSGGGPRYLVSVPAQFSFVCDLKLNSNYSASQSYVVAQFDNNGSGGNYLRLVHDGATGRFRLEGSAGAALEVEVPTEAGEAITFCVTQSGTTRALMVKKYRSDAVVAASGAMVPIGTFGMLALYDTRGIGGSYLASARAVIGDTAIFSAAQTEAEFASYVEDQAPIGFTAWREFVPGEYNVERAAIKIRCDIANPTVKATIVKAVLNMDVPDVVEHRAVSVAAGGTTITFEKDFNAVPTVVAVQSGGTTVAIVVTELVTQTGFTVKLYSASAPSTTVAGQISFTATGY
jgi:hypothetical protein